MRFIGNKEKLASKIYEILKKYRIINLHSKQVFCDLFSGSASMARFFKKQGFQVYSCDLLYFSYCLQKAYIQNNQIPIFEGLNKVLQIHHKIPNDTLFCNARIPYQKVLDILNHLTLKKGFIYRHYAPSGSKDLELPRMYFSDENAQKIDAIRIQIEIWKENKTIDESEYFILLATLIESVSFFANVVGVYSAFCKKWDRRALKPLKLKEIELLQSEKEHFCFCGDSVKMLECLQNNLNTNQSPKHTQTFDILYLDPPYNHRQYAPNYHLLETIAKYDNPKIKGVAGLREYDEQKSKFCNATSALRELENIGKFKNYKNLVLSYNSEGLMKKEQIDEILNPLGKLYFEEIKYPRFKSNTKKGKKYINEYVWILQK